MRIAGLVQAKNGFLDDLDRLIRSELPAEPLWGWPGVGQLRLRIRDAAERAAELCEVRGQSPADLPAPSRRAYQLLSFLSADGRVESHLESLRLLLAVDARVEARFDHTSFLYRFERTRERITLLVSEGFVGAPDDVLRSVVRLAVPYARKAGPRAVVRAYTEAPMFAAALRAIEESGGASQGRTSGAHYDLREVFEVVNRDYFQGRLSPPRLQWTSRPTSREFGTYEATTDTIRLSRSLDREGVPAVVVEHVMHHELLHRVLGAEAKNGRRRFHSPRFRRAERAFHGFAEADAFLRNLAEDAAE